MRSSHKLGAREHTNRCVLAIYEKPQQHAEAKINLAIMRNVKKKTKGNHTD